MRRTGRPLVDVEAPYVMEGMKKRRTATMVYSASLVYTVSCTGDSERVVFSIISDDEEDKSFLTEIHRMKPARFAGRFHS